MPSAREFWVTTTCTRSRDTLAINLASQGSWPGDTEIHCALICKDLSLRVNSCIAFNMICSNSSLRGIWSGPTVKTNKQKNSVSYKMLLNQKQLHVCLDLTCSFTTFIYFWFFYFRSLFFLPSLFFFSLLQTMRYSTSLLASATGGQTREWENMCLLPGREGLSMHPHVFAEENQNAYPYSLITAM